MSAIVATTITEEAGQYQAALGRALVEVTRTGAGIGPNLARSVTVDGADMYSGRVQFPVIGRTTIGDGQLAVLSIIEAPAGSRWCERDLEPGDAMLYGPGAEHYAVSPPGLEYRVAIIELSELRSMGELLGTSFRPPEHGSVTWLDATSATSAMCSVLDRLGGPLDTSAVMPADGTELFEATTHVLADPSSFPEDADRSRINSRRVVSACIDFADSIGRIPTVSEMCCCAHVSERRLRAAFSTTCDLSPNQFFRVRFLGRAHDQLLARHGHTVTEIALDHGFMHLGRFAKQYTQVFGEPPSVTLHAGISSTRRQRRAESGPVFVPEADSRWGDLNVRFR